MFAPADEYRPYTAPVKWHIGDAGWDLYSPSDVILNPFTPCNIPLNVKVDLPVGWSANIIERSSQGRAGVISIGGIIDQGYTGEISVTLINCGKQAIIVHRGDRIAQFVPFMHLMTEADELLPERGEKAFGSTGR